MGRYEPREVRLSIAKCLKGRFPPRKFRYWKQMLGISPDEDGLYWDEDVELMKAFARYKRNGGRSFKLFKIKYYGDSPNASQQAE